MAASNFKYVYLSLYTIQQRNSNGYTYVFGIQQSNKHNGNVVRPNGRKPEVEIPRMRPLKSKYVYFSFYTRYSNEISTALTMFSRSSNTERHIGILSDVWVCCESKMAAINRKQIWHKAYLSLYTREVKFQRLRLCFRDRTIRLCPCFRCRTTRLCPCFRCRTTRLDYRSTVDTACPMCR